MKIDIIPVRGQDYDYFQVVLTTDNCQVSLPGGDCNDIASAATYVRSLHEATGNFMQQFSTVQS